MAYIQRIFDDFGRANRLDPKFLAVRIFDSCRDNSYNLLRRLGDRSQLFSQETHCPNRPI